MTTDFEKATITEILEYLGLNGKLFPLPSLLTSPFVPEVLKLKQKEKRVWFLSWAKTFCGYLSKEKLRLFTEQ